MQIRLYRALNNNYLIQDRLGIELSDFVRLFDFAMSQSLAEKKILVLRVEQFHQLKQSAISEISSLDFEQIVVIGKLNASSKELSIIEFESEDSFINSGLFESAEKTYFIFKGDTTFDFDKVIKNFSRRSHNTRLEIDIEALLDNVNTYKAKLLPETKLMVMVKAFAYGAGSAEISKFLQAHMVDYFGVAFVDEGIELRQNGIELPILVMSPGPTDAPLLMKYSLEPEVYSLDQLKAYISEYKKNKEPLPVHIMLNSGMNRLGFDDHELNTLFELIKTYELLEVKSIMTHLAAADDPKEEHFTLEQIKQLTLLGEKIERDLEQRPLQHCLNSAGILNYSQYQLDMVRLGIGIHGISAHKDSKNKLRFPAKLKTAITQVRSLRQGQTIGYGRVGKAMKDLNIATIPIGYADGYLRDYGQGKAYVLINGEKAFTIGNVCMDMTMIDVTHIDAKAGDEVILFGEDPSIEDLAKWSNSISYEVLTSISSRVQRVFYV